MAKLHPLLHPGVHMIVVGLGVSGVAAVRYGLACGAKVSVSDTGSKIDIENKLKFVEGGAAVQFESNGHTDDFLLQADVLFLSPGVPVDERIKQIKKKGVKVVGELAIAADLIDVPIVAITGTNGKTTVTSLVGELLVASGKNVFIGGNIGTPVLDWLLSGEDVDVVVLEVSSFQLETAGDFCPSIGIVLNITPDHLDRHGSMEEYRSAKLNLFVNQCGADLALVLGDDPFCADAPLVGTSKKVLFGTSDGLDVMAENGHVSFYRNGQYENYSLVGTVLNNNIGMLNSAPAIYAARELGCSVENIEKGLREFDLGEHRLEYIRSIDGVGYYNDSKATNTGAVISGIEQFEKVILIVGGRDKGDDYSLLRSVVSERVKFFVCIGEAAPLIVEALAGLSVPFVEAASLNEAVLLAQQVALPGQTVLLAPGCASFDMFKNYQDRGNQFRDAVWALESSKSEEV